MEFLGKNFLQLPSVNQVKNHIGHSIDGCGKNSKHISWLRLCGRAVIQILLNYLIGFEKVSNVIQITALVKLILLHGLMSF